MNTTQADLAWTKLGSAMNRYAAATLRLDEARNERAAAIKDALRKGMSLREIGALIGVSHSRVHQIANEE